MDKIRLINYIKGDCTEKDKIEIMSWIQEDPKHMKEFMALRKLHDISLWHDYAQNDKEKGKVRKVNFRKMGLELLKVAAVLLIAFLTFQYVLPEFKKPVAIVPHEMVIPSGQHAEVKLSDGSTVWLNSETKFKFEETFTSDVRRVSIDGEGYFDIAKDTKRPFIVDVNGYQVKVHGTQFNVHGYTGDQTLRVSLLEGSVELLSAKGNSLVRLRPNEEAIVKDETINIRKIQDTERFLWREGILNFEKESFAEIIKTLERKYNVRFHVENPKVLEYECTGKFRQNDGVHHILKVLQLSHSFNYKYDNKQNLITIQ
ncbi:FecR family protein [Puteibacter caeruleilacunae]|nr:FecR family protein [Puteibacter caeruleilacunae]